MKRLTTLRISGVVTGGLLLAGFAALHTVRSQTNPAPSRPLAPVAIDSILTVPGGAEVRLSPSADAPRVTVRVDPRGGGDVATIEEAVRRATSGEIAVAAGTYEVDTLDLPPGVSLAGGFDPQTWRYDPARNLTVLAPRDSASALPLVRAHAGSRVSGLVLRDADVAVDLEGDGVVLEGLALSHCRIGVLARASARGIVNYATFVHDGTGLLLERGSEVAAQNSIFTQNGVGIERL